MQSTWWRSVVAAAASAVGAYEPVQRVESSTPRSSVADFSDYPVGDEDRGSPRPKSTTSPRSSTRRRFTLQSDRSGCFRLDYRLERQIGIGSDSLVYQAKHRATSLRVAVKRIETERMDDRRAAFLAREVEIMRELAAVQPPHPCIVRLLAAYDDEDGCYLVEELAAENLLATVKRRSALCSEAEVRTVVRRLLSAAVFLHDRGIVHRDLKPDNCLLFVRGDGGSVKLGDLGLAVRPAQLVGAAPEAACGTAEYVSPEILLQEPFDGRADVWSLGVTTFCLLSGSLPFEGMTVDALFRKVLAASYSFEGRGWRVVSSTAKDFISRMLVANPADRWTSRQLQEHPWLTGVQKPSASLPVLSAEALQAAAEAMAADAGAAAELTAYDAAAAATGKALAVSVTAASAAAERTSGLSRSTSDGAATVAAWVTSSGTPGGGDSGGNGGGGRRASCLRTGRRRARSAHHVRWEGPIKTDDLSGRSGDGFGDMFRPGRFGNAAGGGGGTFDSYDGDGGCDGGSGEGDCGKRGRCDRGKLVALGGGTSGGDRGSGRPSSGDTMARPSGLDGGNGALGRDAGAADPA